MTPQQIDAMKLALEVMRNQGDVSVDEWIATEKAIKEALAEHAMRETQRLGQEIEQEPVAWWDAKLGAFDEKHFDQLQPLYTAPPQRKPLTDKAITKVIDSMPRGINGWMSDWDLYEFARAIEARLKENT